MTGNKMLKTLIKIKDECNKHPGCMGCKHNKKVPDAIICGVHFDSHKRYCDYREIYSIPPCHWVLPRIKETDKESDNEK